MTQPKRVAIIGTRGLPPLYGGRETASHEIGRRLSDRGWDVVVYCRNYNSPKPHPKTMDGIRLVHLPSLRQKHLDTPSHVLLSVMHLVLRERSPLTLLSGVGTAFAIPWLRLFRRRVAMIVDGKAWERAKWGKMPRWYLHRSARLGAKIADSIITDTTIAQETYRREMNRETEYIPYGASLEPAEGTEALDEFGLEPGRYVLFVGRLTPEKGVPFLLDAFEGLETPHQLVIVGDNPYDPDYVASLRARESSRVIFTGYQFGVRFAQLMRNCRLYVQPSVVEGTSPVLLTAMGYARPVIVSGIPENLATVADAGLSFPPGDVAALRRQMAEILDRDDQLADLGERARVRIQTEFDWERITDRFESVFASLLR